MTVETPRPDEERRSELLEETKRTYAAYAKSGYSERWASTPGGMRFAIARRDEWIADALVPAVAGTIVDLGCGSGALGVLLDAVGRRPARLIGVDLLETRLEDARRSVPWAEFHDWSADQLSVSDGSVDAVVAMTLFSSLTDDWFRQRVADEIGRVLRPGGRLVVYDLRFPSPRNRHVRPVGAGSLAELFPGWSIQSHSMTLLPPIARSALAAGPRRYAALEAMPLLRSHIGAVLTRP